MRSPAFSLFLGAAALFAATQAGAAPLPYANPRCAAERGRLDSQSCYCGVLRQYWVTMSGLGVSVPIPSPYERAPSRHRRVIDEGRY